MILVPVTVYITQFHATEDTLSSTDLFTYYQESFAHCPAI